MFYFVGLGNPGKEFELTRHNAGRIILDLYLKKISKFQTWEYDKKLNALKTEKKIGKDKVLFLLPETFMNNSGKAVQKIITSKNKAKDLIALHDDIDLPLGKFKIAFNRGSAGHKGVESIIKAVKTKEFFRIRIGIAPETPSGKLKKPKGKKLLDFLTGNFRPKELEIIKKTAKNIAAALEAILEKR